MTRSMPSWLPSKWQGAKEGASISTNAEFQGCNEVGSHGGVGGTNTDRGLESDPFTYVIPTELGNTPTAALHNVNI